MNEPLSSEQSASGKGAQAPSRLTPWFPSSVRPARAGVYEVWDHSVAQSFYNVWDGRHWYAGSNTPMTASKVQRICARHVPFWVSKWRGMRAASSHVSEPDDKGKPEGIE